MKKFIARQPIFDRRLNAFAYELLYRGSSDNAFHQADPDQATYNVLADSLFLHGLEALTNRRKAFINCTRSVLVNDYATCLPSEVAVAEILETVEPDDEVLEACRRLKQQGYRLALDDVNEAGRVRAFGDLADFIKVDLPAAPPERQQELVRLGRSLGMQLVAEKVESHQEFRQTVAMGFDYFQGYFFSKPEMISRQEIPAFQLNYLRILGAVQEPEVNLEEIEKIIKVEESLCFKLLRYLNSSLFGFRGRIHSIHHALSLLGEKETRLWVSLAALTSMGDGKPEELVVTSLVRAVWCESLASQMGLVRKADSFLMGLFSLLDAILDQPMETILQQLPIALHIKSALLQDDNTFSEILRLVQAYEQGDWATCAHLAKTLRLEEEGMAETYLQAVEWAQQVFRSA